MAPSSTDALRAEYERLSAEVAKLRDEREHYHTLYLEIIPLEVIEAGRAAFEQIYARGDLDVARSTMCGWHEKLAELVRPLVDAMFTDARGAPYLCTDATGVLVQAKKKCRVGHFWVLVAPGKHVLLALLGEARRRRGRRGARRLPGVPRRRCARCL